MNIKNILSLLLAVCMVLSLAACGNSEEPAETTEAATEAVTEVATEPATEAATEAPMEDDNTVTYKVRVEDESGAPIAGAMVQICLDTCLPAITNEEGVAEYQVEEADYKVSFLSLPAGYTYTTEKTEFYFESGSTEMTITLKAEG